MITTRGLHRLLRLKKFFGDRNNWKIFTKPAS